MKRVARVLVLFAALAVGGAARAETVILETWGDTGIDAALDSSIPEVDGAEGDAETAVSDDADATDDTADAAEPIDTAYPPDSPFEEDANEASVDSGADTRPAPIDSTLPADTGQPSKPPMITENPSDPFSRDPDRDGCTCNAPKTAGDAGAYAAIVALAAVMLRRKRR